LSDEHIAQLNASFSDLIKSGKITKADPAREEKDEPE